MTREQFQDNWLNNHGPFFMKNAAGMKARRYVQSHTIDTPINEGMNSPEGQKIGAA